MADVKKSRIVSDNDDNLEKALMEEFNIRLKSCMSQDNLQNPDDEEEDNSNRDVEGSTENSIYENLEAMKVAAKDAPQTLLSPQKANMAATSDFIQIERDSYDEEPRNDAESGDSNDIAVAHSVDNSIYDSTSVENDKTDQNNISDQYVEMHSVEMIKSPAERAPAEYEEMSPVKSEGANVVTVNNKHVYEIVEPPGVVVNGGEKERPTITLPTTCLTDMSDLEQDQNGAEVKSVKDRMFLSTDDTSCLLFTQTVTSPMLTPSEENIDFLKGFRRESTQNTDTTDNTQSNDSPKSVDMDVEEKAITEGTNDSEDVFTDHLVTDLDDLDPPLDHRTKRLSTDDQDPIYANTLDDEVNGFEGETPVKEHIYENAEFLKRESENIYENVEIIKESKSSVDSPSLYENVTDLKYGETIYQNLQDLEYDAVQFTDEKAESCPVTPQEVPQETVDVQKAIDVDAAEEAAPIQIEAHAEQRVTDLQPEEELAELPEKTSQQRESKVAQIAGNIFKDTTEGSVENREKDTETVPPQIVQNLKSQFLKSSTSAEIVGATTKKEIEDVGELKTINILKHITKFESKDSVEEIQTSSTTQVHESYVETHTYEEISGGSDRALKKKKAKKSRKEEKENISVCNSNGESYYNVNVKSLCRSFGDLTNIDDENSFSRRLPNKTTNDRLRTKSLSDVSLSSNKPIENVFSGVSVKALRDKFSNGTCKKCRTFMTRCSRQCSVDLKSSFNKFDALQKKNLLHVRSSDSTNAQEKFNGNTQIESSNCKSCGKVVFQMEQIKAERAVYHRNCFRCQECKKQLTVDTYQSHEGTVYCNPHFKALFAPKAVEDEEPPSDKPDLGLEELQSLNVKERFQVFEHHQQQTETNEIDRTAAVNVKRSPSILSKLAKFQAKGMDIGVTDETLNGIPIEESSEEEEEEEPIQEGDDPDLIRAKRVQREKPFHFTGMSDVKNKWEQGPQNAKEQRREEHKQEIQSIRNKLFMGKQGKMKEAYQQAVMEAENTAKKQTTTIEANRDTRALKERFERGEIRNSREETTTEQEEEEVYESEISKKSRSMFLELDANSSKPPQLSPVTPPKLDVRKAREAYLTKTSSEDVVKSSEIVDDVTVKTADIQQRFKFFETYREPEKERKQFRITPPREGQVKSPSPEREVYRDPEVVRAEEVIEDSVIAKEAHTATKMLNKFRQMEENLSKEPAPQGPKPLKRFTPPPEPARPESSSEGESASEEEDVEDAVDHSHLKDVDLLEAQKAARAKQLRAKFEKWEANEIKKEQTNGVNIVEEMGEDQSQIESTRVLRARFEQMREMSTETKTSGPRVKVNRFVKIPSVDDICKNCQYKVYPLEKISVHGDVYHKNCFKCMECSTILRMDSYSYNQGLLYCKPHFKRLFISKGNYDTAFGLEQHKEKWNATVA